MNKKEKQAILKILLIKEELSEKEFNNVIKFICDTASSNVSTETLIKNKLTPVKEIKETVIELIGKIKDIDSEKYNIINEFYHLTKDGTVFRTFPEVKEFIDGCGLKSLLLKTKRETVNEIIKYLLNIPKEDAVRILKNHVVSNNDNDNESYKKLSNFIINNKAGGS